MPVPTNIMVNHVFTADTMLFLLFVQLGVHWLFLAFESHHFDGPVAESWFEIVVGESYLWLLQFSITTQSAHTATICRRYLVVGEIYALLLFSCGLIFLRHRRRRFHHT